MRDTGQGTGVRVASDSLCARNWLQCRVVWIQLAAWLWGSIFCVRPGQRLFDVFTVTWRSNSMSINWWNSVNWHYSISIAMPACGGKTLGVRAERANSLGWSKVDPLPLQHHVWFVYPRVILECIVNLFCNSRDISRRFSANVSIFSQHKWLDWHFFICSARCYSRLPRPRIKLVMMGPWILVIAAVSSTQMRDGQELLRPARVATPNFHACECLLLLAPSRKILDSCALGVFE